MDPTKEGIPSLDDKQTVNYESMASREVHQRTVLELAAKLSAEAKEALEKAFARIENKDEEVSLSAFFGELKEQIWGMPGEEKAKLREFRLDGGDNYGEEVLKFLDSHLR